MLYVGIVLLLLGATMMTRGWIYTLRPEGKMAEKRKRRNLRVGFTTDMKLFGRKVRRLGLMIVLIGAASTGWALSVRREEAARTAGPGGKGPATGPAAAASAPAGASPAP